MGISESGPERGCRARVAWGILALGSLTALAYLPALRGGFIWDDDHFLTLNPLIRAADGLRRFWFTTEAPDYWPVTSSSLWLEWRLWGMQAAGYHATNVILHIGSSLLLWAVLRKLRIPGAYLAAVLFALHPVNVESVAWITQRKNLLAMVFGLGSVWAYLQGEAVGSHALTGAATRARRWYGLSLLAFVLGMLSKGSLATLPVVILGLIAWRRRLSAWDGVRILPFGLVAAALTGANVWLQHRHAVEAIRTAGWGERLLEAGAIAWFYLGKAVLPVRLSFCYPQWTLSPGQLAGWLPVLAAVGGLWAARRARAALAYFLIMLVPVLGLTDVYFMRYSLVADHYQHLALIGVVAGAAAGWARWRKTAGSAVPLVVAAAVVAACGVLTWRQCGHYRDRLTLWQTTLEANPRSWMAYNNLGTLRQEQGQGAEAIADYRQALAIDPGLADVHFNLANSLADAGREEAALSEYRAALGLRPQFPEAYYCEALVLGKAGHPTEALADFDRAVQIRPHFPEAQNDWGNLLLSQDRLEEAMAQFRAALRDRPGFPAAHYNLGVALARSGRLDEAMAEYRQALAHQPNYPEAENNLGAALALSGRNDEAIQHYQRALQLRPDYAEARYNLELARKAGAP